MFKADQRYSYVVTLRCNVTLCKWTKNRTLYADYANMVIGKLNSPFLLNIVNFPHIPSNFNTRVKKRLFKLVFDCYVPSQKCIKIWRVTWKNNNIVERHETQRRLPRVTISCKLYLRMIMIVMMVKIITNVFGFNFHS